MVVYNDKAECTEDFNEYLDTTLEPTIEALCSDVVAWLESNNAETPDYLLAKGVITLNISYIMEIAMLDKNTEDDRC